MSANKKPSLGMSNNKFCLSFDIVYTFAIIGFIPVSLRCNGTEHPSLINQSRRMISRFTKRIKISTTANIYCQASNLIILKHIKIART